MKIVKIIFVCMGNTCRSPMAEGICKKLNEDKNIQIESRGLAAVNGASAAENAVEVMKQMGIDISSHRAKNFTQADLDTDRIICMTNEIYAFFLRLGVPESKLEVLGGGIPDPYGGDLEVYRKCAELIEKSLKNK